MSIENENDTNSKIRPEVTDEDLEITEEEYLAALDGLAKLIRKHPRIADAIHVAHPIVAALKDERSK